jgi:hypothetical protein
VRFPLRLTPARLPLFRAALLGGLITSALPAGAAEELPPRLAVVIAVDQFRGDYLQRFAPYFSAEGFKRLTGSGLVFEDCRYRHAVTKTAPGHATILSGGHAETHGIVANDWFDRTLGRTVESVEDAAFPIVGASPSVVRSPGGVVEAKAGRSPRSFLGTTVGDQLKLRFGSRSKVFSVSNKDRSAILLGGKLADSAYWIDRGRLVTSAYYRAALPNWVETFNGSRRVEAVFGQTWDRLREAALYDAVQGPDDAPGESSDFGLSRTFPRKLDGGGSEISPDFYGAFDNSPFSAALIGDFAEQALREEQLGQDEITDLLCVSFSQIDTVGHSYGPDSHELMDSVLRLDAIIAGLLNALDKQVGLSRCVIVLSADHGASPLPERVLHARPEIPAGRFNGGALDSAVADALHQAFGAPTDNQRWFVRDNFGYHLQPTVLAQKKLTLSTVADVVKSALLTSNQVAGAFTRDEFATMPADGDSLPAMLRRSFFPARSQDVIFVLKPYIVDRKLGTNHGSPYAYDTHVPLVFFGVGVPSGTRSHRVGVDDLAPTLAALLHVPAPPEAVGQRLF